MPQKSAAKRPKKQATPVKKSVATPAAKTATREVDAELAKYRSMRDFGVTEEPSGGKRSPVKKKSALPFVIQKHAATRLHYDFRLGWRGVLKSWAVAKGPSYNTHDRRLAVEVEDHPIEYGGFEGTIPKGQYGGGAVLIWDQGTWEPKEGTDVDEGLKAGSLKFTLHGEKLQGSWTLVRMKPRGSAKPSDKPNWLLIKEHDGNERNDDNAIPITDESPNSVVTGRSLEDIARAEDHVWQSKPAEKSTPRSYRTRLQEKLAAAHLHGTAPHPPKPEKKAPSESKTKEEDTGEHESMPAFLPPQLATPAKNIPTGTHWLHELKLDGYRIQLHVSTQRGKRKATLFTRSGLDWTHRMAAVARAAEKIPVDAAILDGEVVVLDDQGTSSFSRLQAAFEKGDKEHLTYFAFDLLHLNGRNTRRLPLQERKALLEPLIVEAGEPLLQFSRHLSLDAKQVFDHACALGAEGLISKSAEARYIAGRSDAWRKLKCTLRQEFVIAGFTPPGDGGTGIGSILLGYYEDDMLIHCGRSGTGFTQESARSLRKKLEALRQPKPAYSKPLAAMERRDALWVKPELVCEVAFATWTADGSVRHASFQGLRTDKPAREVVREMPSGGNAPSAEGPTLDQEERKVSHSVGDTSIAAKRSTKPSKKASVAADETPDPMAEISNSLSGKKKSSRRPATASKKSASTADGDADAKSSHGIRITHPDKVLDETSGTTKQQLADYFEAVAEHILPHIEGRPLSIVRCPNGTGKPCFFQKHAQAGLPAGVGAVDVPDKENSQHSEPYITIDNAPGLVGLAQIGVLEVHPWGSHNRTLEKPDRIIFDLDPDPSISWPTMAESALAIRAFLRELRLESWLKSTGGKGLHIVVPIQPRAEWPQIKLFARGVAAAIESGNPSLYLIKMSKAARKNRIFLDWLRNERGATAVAPWSPRARAGMRVAVPLAWEELKKGQPEFAVADFEHWKSRLKNDPWKSLAESRQSLDADVLQTVLQQTEGKRG